MREAPPSYGPGIKERELRAICDCSICHKPIGHGGPLFWRLTFKRYGLEGNALRRQQGLGMMLGSASLAMVMGADEDLAVPMMPPKEITICEPCFMDKTGMLPMEALSE